MSNQDFEETIAKALSEGPESSSPSADAILSGLTKRLRRRRNRSLGGALLLVFCLVSFSLWQRPNDPDVPLEAEKTAQGEDDLRVPEVDAPKEEAKPSPQGGDAKPIKVPPRDSSREALIRVIKRYRPIGGVVRKYVDGSMIVALHGLKPADEAACMNALEAILATWDSVSLAIHEGEISETQVFIRWTEPGVDP